MLQQSKPEVVIELEKEKSIIDLIIEDTSAPKPPPVQPAPEKGFKSVWTVKELQQEWNKELNYKWQAVWDQMKAAKAYAEQIRYQARSRRCNCACAPCLDGDCSKHMNPRYDTGIPHINVTVSAKRIDTELGL